MTQAPSSCFTFGVHFSILDCSCIFFHQRCGGWRVHVMLAGNLSRSFRRYARALIECLFSQSLKTSCIFRRGFKRCCVQYLNGQKKKGFSSSLHLASPCGRRRSRYYWQVMQVDENFFLPCIVSIFRLPHIAAAELLLTRTSAGLRCFRIPFLFLRWRLLFSFDKSTASNAFR